MSISKDELLRLTKDLPSLASNPQIGTYINVNDGKHYILRRNAKLQNGFTGELFANVTPEKKDKLKFLNAKDKLIPLVNKYLLGLQIKRELEALSISAQKKYNTPWIPGKVYTPWELRKANCNMGVRSEEYYDFINYRADHNDYFDKTGVIPTGELPKIEGNVSTISDTSLYHYIFKDSTPEEIKIVYITTSFFRNVIDFLHDYLHVGVDYVFGAGFTKGPLFLLFEQVYAPKIVEHKLQDYYNKYVENIKTIIIPVSKNVNQNTCKDITNQLLTDFHTIISSKMPELNWQIGKKEDGLIFTADLNNTDELKELLSKLQNNGIKGVYIESLGASAKPIYELAPDYGLAYVYIKSGDWDGGTGYSFDSAYKARQEYIANGKASTTNKLTQLIFSRSSLPGSGINNKGIEKKTVTIQPIQTFNSAGHILSNDATATFGIIPISIDEGSNMLRLFDITTFNNIININPEKGKPAILSVNSILKTLGLPFVRGIGVQSVKSLNITYASNNKINPIGILMTKQWTDTIQTIDSLADTSNNKIAMVYYDDLAEKTNFLEGGKATLLYKGGRLYYYSYDKRAKQISGEMITKKLSTYLKLVNGQSAIMEYIQNWFDNIHTGIEFMLNDTDDPAIYFAAYRIKYLLEKRFTEYQKDFITLIEDAELNYAKRDFNSFATFPDTVEQVIDRLTQSKQIVSEFNNVFSIINGIIQKIKEQPGRLAPISFIDFFARIKQEIINVVGNTYPNIDSIVPAVFAYGFMIEYDEKLYPNNSTEIAARRRGLASLKTSLESVKSELCKIKNISEEERIKTTLHLDAIYSLAENIESQGNLFCIPFINIIAIVSGIKISESRKCTPEEIATRKNSEFVGGSIRKTIRKINKIVQTKKRYAKKTIKKILKRKTIRKMK
jgi:hypothetical protein